jgi:HEPN domain-containing protein
MNRRLFQKLAEARLVDAKALLKAKRYDAAYYMAGYAIECALKACIAKKTRLYDFPPKNAREVYTHELEDLVKSAEIGKSFQQDRVMDSKLAEYWEIVKEWKPEDGRYGLRGATGVSAAKELVLAIDDRHHGVLQCLSKYW